MAAQQREKKCEIKKPKLLLVEGADAYYFWIWAIEAYRIEDVQVMDFGGISQLHTYLKTVINLPGYEKVTTIVVARDAETKPAAAVSSIKKALKESGLAVPAKPFSFSGDSPRIAFMLFPGFDGTEKLISGTLEDLCIQILNDNDAKRLNCATDYLSCLEQMGKKITWKHKSFLHAYFAGEDRFVGMKIGEASRAGAWDWEHERLKFFKEIIKAM
jgi:hypothetical protein